MVDGTEGFDQARSRVPADGEQPVRQAGAAEMPDTFESFADGGRHGCV